MSPCNLSIQRYYKIVLSHISTSRYSATITINPIIDLISQPYGRITCSVCLEPIIDPVVFPWHEITEACFHKNFRAANFYPICRLWISLWARKRVKDPEGLRQLILFCDAVLDLNIVPPYCHINTWLFFFFSLHTHVCKAVLIHLIVSSLCM